MGFVVCADCKKVVAYTDSVIAKPLRYLRVSMAFACGVALSPTKVSLAGSMSTNMLSQVPPSERPHGSFTLAALRQGRTFFIYWLVACEITKKPYGGSDSAG